jgi:outer membrane immunogenic protein
MRKFVVATAAVMAFAGSAQAGDLGPASYDAEPRAGAVTVWTGCYGGGFAGGLWGSSDKWIVRTPGGDFCGQSLGGHDLDSFIGGVQAGCDY